tara:strand:- start:99 stop:701 length:603 start_codon:yes stop_codon:yes gene_type:complete
MTKLFIFTLSYIFYSCSGSSTGPENTELPLIQNYQFNIDEDSQLVSTLPKTNNSSRGLTYTIKTNPLNGQVNIIAGDFTYTPNLNFFGEETFNYSISNNDQSTEDGTVSINIRPINDAPIVEENINFFVTTGDNFLTLTGFDVDNDNLFFRITSFTGSGSLEIDLFNQVKYNGPGNTFFDYVANDGTVDSNKGRVSIIPQ